MAESNLQSDTRLATREIGIDGMTCDHCVKRVEKALQAVQGITHYRVDRQRARATVTFDSQKTDIPAIHDAVLRSGYKPSIVPPE